MRRMRPNATDVEAAKISQTADAARAAENAADATRTMTARRMTLSQAREILRATEAMAPPAKRAKKKPHWWHHRAQEAQDNAIKSDDNADVNDVNNDDLPAELGECSMGNDGLDSPPDLQLTGHTSRASGDEETLVELSLKKRFVETNSLTLPFSCWERAPGLNERQH